MNIIFHLETNIKVYYSIDSIITSPVTLNAEFSNQNSMIKSSVTTHNTNRLIDIYISYYFNFSSLINKCQK